MTVLQFSIFSRFQCALCFGLGFFVVLVIVLGFVLFCFVFFKNKHKSYITTDQQGTFVLSQ